MSTLAVAFAPSQVRPLFQQSKLGCWEEETWAAILVSYLAEKQLGWDAHIALTELVSFGHRGDHPDWDRLLQYELQRTMSGLGTLATKGYLGVVDTDTRYVFVKQRLIDFYQSYV